MTGVLIAELIVGKKSAEVWRRNRVEKNESND